MSKEQGSRPTFTTTASKSKGQPTMANAAPKVHDAELVLPGKRPKLARDPMTNTTMPEEQFCVEVIRTGNLSEAYRRVFPDKVARMKNPDKAGYYAQLLAHEPRIQARLEAMRAVARETLGITLHDHLESLKDLRDGAKAANQFGPAVAAEVGRGKVSGLYVEKVEHSGDVHIIASAFDERL